MSELKHWLDETSDADEFERAILRAGFEADPSDAKRDQIWTSLAATLAAAPLVAATTSVQAASTQAAAIGASKAGAVWLAVAKGFLVGLAVYGAAAGVSEISGRLSARPAPTVTTQRSIAKTRATSGSGEASGAASALPLPPTGDDAPKALRAAQRGSGNALAREPLHPTPDLPSVATFDDSKPPGIARASQLEAETRALRRARDELRANKLADAFATLDASRRQFSAPELYQEREALMIELLHRSGQRAAAEQRANAFLGRFPESPHVQQIRRMMPP